VIENRMLISKDGRRTGHGFLWEMKNILKMNSDDDCAIGMHSMSLMFTLKGLKW
jgi:hypothetical protein